MDASEILKSTPFFAEALDDKEIVLLSDRAREVAFNPGEKVVEEDAPASSMFVIVDGHVSVTVKGEDEPVATLESGAVVGEMSLLTGAPRNATATALGPVTAIEIDKHALANVLWMAPTLVDRFVEMLFRRQRELDRAYGGNAWGMMRPGKAELAQKINDFFQDTSGEEVVEAAPADEVEAKAAEEAVRDALETAVTDPAAATDGKPH